LTSPCPAVRKNSKIPVNHWNLMNPKAAMFNLILISLIIVGLLDDDAKGLVAV
jgi:hypothetical protein